jgi:TonB family protein
LDGFDILHRFPNMDSLAASANARGMSFLKASLPVAVVAACLNPAPIRAMQSSPAAVDYAADQCIGYNRNSADSFNLINNCESAIDVAICVEEAGQGCASPERFVRQAVAVKAQLPQTYKSLQILNIFACKAPAVVQLAQGGLAACDPTGLANLPLLLSSSLKNAASIITASDYPSGVKAEGNTRFEMRVGADGKPQSCYITVSSGKEALDKATCNAFMRRARFSPAKDSSGRMIEGRYRGNVAWKEQ